jgi:hypothetical protein
MRLVHQTSVMLRSMLMSLIACVSSPHAAVQVTQESRIAETQAKRANLTLRELKGLDAAANCYQSVGRA